MHQHSGSCSNCSRVVGDEPSESAVVGVAPMALGRRSARRHDRCLGLSQQGSADGSSRSRSERRDGRCWVVQVQSGHRDARPDRPGLDLGGGTAAAGSARSRSGSLTPLLGHPGLDPGALHPCWVVQVWIRGRHGRCLGRSQQGIAARSFRSRSGRRCSRCWIGQVSIREPYSTVGVVQVWIRGRHGRCLGRSQQGSAARSSRSIRTTPTAHLERPSLDHHGVTAAWAQPIRAANDTHPAKPRRSIDTRARPAWSPTTIVRACTYSQVGTPVGLTPGIKLRGPEGAQRPRATSASMSELGCSLVHSGKL